MLAKMKIIRGQLLGSKYTYNVFDNWYCETNLPLNLNRNSCSEASVTQPSRVDLWFIAHGTRNVFIKH